MNKQVEQIRAEIERLKKDNNGSPLAVCNDLLSFIDSIPEEPVNEDLDDEIVDWCNHLDYVDFDYEAIRDAARHIANWQKQKLMNELWHKGTDNPGNKHPYPVINPDTQEMAFAYYYYGWQFDRDYNPGCNMLWLDIEKIIPNK